MLIMIIVRPADTRISLYLLLDLCVYGVCALVRARASARVLVRVILRARACMARADARARALAC